MIEDSVIWKLELKQKTEKIKRLISEIEFSYNWYLKKDGDDWSNSYKFIVELKKYCFYSSVISRKLLESDRLSDELKSKNFLIKYFLKKNEKILTKWNFILVEDEYNLKNEFIAELTLKKICDLFIHSFAFVPKFIKYKINKVLPDDDFDNWEISGIAGLYINSNYTKKNIVYYFELDLIFKIYEDVYQDLIVFISENRQTNEIKRSKYPHSSNF